jgi:hypothetical protein
MSLGVVVAIALVALFVAALAWAWRETDKAEAIDLRPPAARDRPPLERGRTGAARDA